MPRVASATAELRPELPHPARDDRDAAGEVEQRVAHGGDPMGL